MGRLQGAVVLRDDLSARDRDRMHALLVESFAGVSREGFEQDLADKHWVILLRTGDGTIGGFTTLALMAGTLAGQPVRALFSGDTIVQPALWGERALPRTWMRFAREVRAEAPATPLWWFLICMGYKTYRFLPLFTRAYWPRPGRPTPAGELALLDELAHRRFPEDYDPVAGVVRSRGRGYRLRDGVAGITPGRLRDPAIRFFLERNPGHGQGDELVCLASLAEENLTRAALRVRDGDGG